MGNIKKNKASIKHFEELISPIYEMLYKYIYCIVRNKSMAEDALQNTFLNAFSHISDLRDESKFKYWIFTIGKRESINILRSYSRELTIDFTSDDILNDFDSYYADEIILNEEIRDSIIEIVNSFKPEDRDIVLLRYYNDLTLNEISQVLNINYNTIRTKHKNIKRKIYKGLKSKGLI